MKKARKLFNLPNISFVTLWLAGLAFLILDWRGIVWSKHLWLLILLAITFFFFALTYYIASVRAAWKNKVDVLFSYKFAGEVFFGLGFGLVTGGIVAFATTSEKFMSTFLFFLGFIGVVMGAWFKRQHYENSTLLEEAKKKK